MRPNTIKLSSLKPNDRNPRNIKTADFEKLVNSIRQFGSKMLPLRPIVIDEHRVILGGNMRYHAIKSLGYVEIPKEWVKQVTDLTEEEKNEFIIRDNVDFGEWNWDTLANEFDMDKLPEWGLDLPMFPTDESGLNNKSKAKLDYKIKFSSLEQKETVISWLEGLKLKHPGADLTVAELLINEITKTTL